MSENHRYVDFDAMFAEMKREPVVIKVYGETVELPPSLPASIMLRTLRLMEAGDQAEVPPTEVLALANSIFGADRLQDWADNHGLDVEQMGLMIRHVSQIYGGGDTEAGSSPNRRALRKSERGNKS